jgi:hypothetical protein
MILSFKHGLILIGFGLSVLIGSRVAHAAPPADACSLLTAAQVSAVLGGPVATTTPDPKKLCIWSPGGVPGPKTVTLSFWDPTAFPSPKTALLPGAVLTPVSGLGDQAVYTGVQNEGYSGAFKLFVKKSGTVFSITVSGFPVDQTKEKEKTLALNVLGKL